MFKDGAHARIVFSILGAVYEDYCIDKYTHHYAIRACIEGNEAVARSREKYNSPAYQEMKRISEVKANQERILKHKREQEQIKLNQARLKEQNQNFKHE